MTKSLFVLLLCLVAFRSYSLTVYVPNSTSGMSTNVAYCQGASASPLQFTFNTCHTGAGAVSGVSLNITWYKNTTNSVSGGTAVSTSSVAAGTNAVDTITYTPSTAATGTLYYYCVLTWTGTGTCNTLGTLTSATTTKVTVAAPASPIAGTLSVCNGSSVTLSNSTAGGTWSSSAPGTASINATSGVTEGVAAGTATIFYTTGCGTPATTSFTVNNLPAAITGATSVCSGSATTHFSCTTSGGSWSSSASSVATVSGSGDVTGITPGFALITYSVGSCNALKSINVNTAPVAVSGAATVCAGLTTHLTDATAGGTWSVINGTGTGTVTAGGVVTGITSGAITAVYSIGSCVADFPMTVSVAPTAITGTTFACMGATTAYSNSVAGGVWSSDDTLIATINSSTGVITGVNVGFAITTYTIGSCIAIQSVTVVNAPQAVTGPSAVCLGNSINWVDSSAGGYWSSDNSSIATINTETGLITGVAGGATTISYTMGTCSSTGVLLVNTPVPVIAGSASVCTGTTTLLSDSVSGGTWSVNNATGAATIDSVGDLTGISAGTVTVTYTAGACNTSFPVSVNQSPAAIVGLSALCARTTTTYADEVGGGTWSVTDTTIATIDPVNGTLTGVRAGTDTIKYTIGGCFSTNLITVNVSPSLITGPSEMCVSGSVQLADSVNGGVWSKVNGTGAATISTSGKVTSSSNGTVAITYTIGSCSAYTTITIVSAPVAIAGPANVCQHSTITLSDIVGGGRWLSATPSTASADTFTGIITGNIPGSVVVTYSNGSCSATKTITVTGAPVVAVITGTTIVCVGSVVTLRDVTAGGVWSSADTTKAKISAAGIVTGISAGSVAISYAVTNSCATVYGSIAVTVKPLPFAGTITGNPVVCTGYTTTLTDTVSGGIWSSFNAKATVTSGVVTGVTAGTDTIRYTYTNTCGTAVARMLITVNTTGTWLGTYSTNWNDAANWPCGYIPDSIIDITIPAGTTYAPQIPASGVGTTRNLTINAGATVTLSSGVVLNIKGNLINNGTITGGGSTIMNNSSAQTITGKGLVSNLSINNTSGVSVGALSRVTIINTLSVVSGTFATGDSVVLASDSNATARVTALPASGAAITGNMRVMQYVLGGHRAYRFWSHPFSNAITLSQIEAYIDVTGFHGSANGFTTTSLNSASAFRYNPLYGNSGSPFDPGWFGFNDALTTSSDTDKFHQYQGIRLFIRGTKGQGLLTTSYTPSPVTIGMFGTINQGNQKIVLAKGTAANQDYNMVGNPYASPVDIGTVVYNAKVAGNIAGTGFYIWNPYMGTAGQFQTIAIDGTPYYLQASTCFQVRAADNGDTLNFTEANKSATITTTLCRSTPEYLSLTIYDANYHPWDMLQVKFNNEATDKEDNNYDAGKLLGFAGFNFYSISADSQKLAIDTRPYNKEKTIPLGLSSQYANQFIIKSEGMVTSNGNPIYLHDKLLQQYILLGQGTEYSFSITDDIATQGNNRFELAMRQSEPINVQDGNNFHISMMPNPATDEVKITFTGVNNEDMQLNVLDVSGVSVYNQNLGAQQNGSVTIPVSKLSTGLYMVEITAGGKKVTQKLIKE